MSTISIELSGPDGAVHFHNDWDVCEAQGLLHIEDLEGWYGGVGSNLTGSSLFGRHGTHTSPALRGHRSLTLTLSWVETIDPGSLAYTRFSRFASGLAWDSGPYLLTVNEDGVILSTEVRLDGEPKHNTVQAGSTQAFRFQLPLRAESPFLYGQSRMASMTPKGAGVGLEFPLFTAAGAAGAGRTVPTFEDNLAVNASLTSLQGILGTGEIGAGGGATIYPSTDWAPPGTEGSLYVGPGRNRSSSAYLLPRYTPIAEWAGRLVKFSGTIHMDEAMPDQDGNDANPPRSLAVGLNDASGAASHWVYSRSETKANAAGDHTVSGHCILPVDTAAHPTWFLRAFNGSQQIPVWWGDIKLQSAETVLATVKDSVILDTHGRRVVQSFAIDAETGDIYAGQPEPSSDDKAHIRRFSADGKVLGELYLPTIGHVNDLGIERDGDDIWIWTYWQGQAPVRIKYRTGTMEWGDPNIEVLYPPAETGVSGETYFSIHGDTVAVQYGGPNYYTSFYLYDLEDFKAGNAVSIGHIPPEPIWAARQGFCHDDEYVYSHRGGSKSDMSHLWRYRWSDGTWDVIRTTGAAGTDSTEAEGVQIVGDSLYVGLASGPFGKRVYHIAKIDPAADFERGGLLLEGDPSGSKVLTFGKALNEEVTVTAYGNATTYPTLRVVGDFPGGVTVTAGSGRKGSITYPYPISRSVPLVIETSGIAWLGGSNVTARLTRRDFESFALRIGDTLSPTFSGLQGGSGELEVHISDAYI